MEHYHLGKFRFLVDLTNPTSGEKVRCSHDFDVVSLDEELHFNAAFHAFYKTVVRKIFEVELAGTKSFKLVPLSPDPAGWEGVEWREYSWVELIENSPCPRWKWNESGIVKLKG